MRALTILTLISCLAPSALAHSEHAPTPERIVAMFHEALEQGDREAALALLSPEVIIFESGGAEASRDEYESHHLGSDMEFLAATETEIVDRRSGIDGDHAWVLSRSETSGTFREKEIDIVGTETIVLERTEKGWRIVHIHWSSHARRSGH